MSTFFARNTLAPVSTLARRVQWPSISTLMPYLYVVVLGLTVLLIQPVLIDGPGAIDVNASAVLPLALVAFGQTLAMFTRGIDLSVGGIISLTTAILATSRPLPPAAR